MRLPLAVAVVTALGLGCAAPVLAKSSSTPDCAPGDPVVTVDMTSKTYVLDRPLRAVPGGSGGERVSPGPASSGMAMSSPEPMGSPTAMSSPMAMGSMTEMCESKAGMMGMSPANGTPATQK